MDWNSKATTEVKISEENLLRLTAYANSEIEKNVMGEYFGVMRYPNNDNITLHYKVFGYERYKWITACLQFFADEIISFLGYRDNFENNDEFKIVWRNETFLEYKINAEDKLIENANYNEFSECLVKLDEYAELRVFLRFNEVDKKHIKEALTFSKDFKSFSEKLESLSKVCDDQKGKGELQILGIEETDLYSKGLSVNLYADNYGMDIAYISYTNKKYTLLTNSEIGKLEWNDRVCSEKEKEKLRIRYSLVKGVESGEVIIPYKHAITLFNSFEYKIRIKHKNEWTSPCNLCVNRLKKVVSGCDECVFKAVTQIETVDKTWSGT